MLNFQQLDLISPKFIKEEHGQALTEYGAIIAFISVIIAMVFTFTQGQLSYAVQQSYSSMSQQLLNLCSAADQMGS